MSEVHKLVSEALEELTFNSRPIIMKLTQLAEKYKRVNPEVVVQLIEERIRKVRVMFYTTGIQNYVTI